MRGNKICMSLLLPKYGVSPPPPPNVRRVLCNVCWFQIERMNFLLHSLVDIVRKGEKPEGRLITHLLTNPSDDGGQI